MGKQDFTRFGFNLLFRQISYIAQGPRIVAPVIMIATMVVCPIILLAEMLEDQQQNYEYSFVKYDFLTYIFVFIFSEWGLVIVEWMEWM